MNNRQKKILFAVTQEYIETGVPVSSKVVISKYGLDVSSATVRSEMVFLEDNGYLTQPHISAGRVPTDIGYRFYVDNLMQVYRLSKLEREVLDRGYSDLCENVNQLLRQTGDFLSEMLNCTAFITSPDQKDVYLTGTSELVSHPEFNDVQKIRNLIRGIENQQNILKVIREDLPGKKEFMLKIGKEFNIPLLEDCSLIAAKYKIDQRPAGFLGMLTVKRASYDKIRTMVGFVVKKLETAFHKISFK